MVKFIDQAFPFAQKEPNGGELPDPYGLVHRLDALMNIVDRVAPELLTLDHEDAADLEIAKSIIRDLVAHKHHLWGYLRQPRVTPVAAIRAIFARCPDESPAATTADLAFIADDTLRQVLRSDIAAVDRALANAEWKAATVLAGSVIEALLLWAIQQKTPPEISAAAARATNAPKAKGDPVGWHLHEYIEVAAELDLIKPDTAKQARLAKDFRNLIHPGRAQRLKQKCDRATALSAVAAMEHVVGDLS
ncbi:MAG TPA: hypothetical protein VEB21_18995 [Terriglobales bacterium]|nr:hypothetical protein [Terriglobales bacterium]